jgi:CheY-like chemotaxis protein
MEKKRILIVDDEQSFTAMLKLNLESSGGYIVSVVNDSLQAIQTALNFQPALILLDIIMPDMEGPDVASEIQQNQTLQRIPIIFLTATVTKEEVDRENGLIGGHPFVAKPSNLTELIESIETNLSIGTRN